MSDVSHGKQQTCRNTQSQGIFLSLKFKKKAMTSAKDFPIFRFSFRERFIHPKSIEKKVRRPEVGHVLIKMCSGLELFEFPLRLDRRLTFLLAKICSQREIFPEIFISSSAVFCQTAEIKITKI